MEELKVKGNSVKLKYSVSQFLRFALTCLQKRRRMQNNVKQRTNVAETAEA